MYTPLRGRWWNQSQFGCPCILLPSACSTYLNQITDAISQALLGQGVPWLEIVADPFLVRSEGLTPVDLTVYHVFVEAGLVGHLEYVWKHLPVIQHQVLQLIPHSLVLVVFQLPLLSEENWAIVLLVEELLPGKETVQFWKEIVEGISGGDFLFGLVRVLCSFLSTGIFCGQQDVLIELQGLCCTRKILIRNLVFGQLFATDQSCSPPTFVGLLALDSFNTFLGLVQLAGLNPGIIWWKKLTRSPRPLYLHFFHLDLEQKIVIDVTRVLGSCLWLAFDRNLALPILTNILSGKTAFLFL